MAKLVFKNPYCLFNSVDLSDHVSQIEFEIDDDLVDSTTGGNTAQDVEYGIEGGTLSITFRQDTASSSVDATLWAARKTKITVVVQHPNNSGTATATNPTYTFTGMIATFNPLGGSIRQMHDTTVRLQTAGTAVARATS